MQTYRRHVRLADQAAADLAASLNRWGRFDLNDRLASPMGLSTADSAGRAYGTRAPGKVGAYR